MLLKIKRLLNHNSTKQLRIEIDELKQKHRDEVASLRYKYELDMQNIKLENSLLKGRITALESEIMKKAAQIGTAWLK